MTAATNIDLAAKVRGVVLLIAMNGKSGLGSPALIVANPAGLCHKRNLHRPADQGLPCRCPCRLFRLRNKSSTFNALTSILAGLAPLRARYVRGNRRAKCPS
jgi:hypothetical protein